MIEHDGFPFDDRRLDDALAWLLLELRDHAPPVETRAAMNLLWTAELESLRDLGHALIGGGYAVGPEGPFLVDALAAIRAGSLPNVREKDGVLSTLLTREDFKGDHLSRANCALLDWTLCRYGSGGAKHTGVSPMVRLFGSCLTERPQPLSVVLERLRTETSAREVTLEQAAAQREFARLFR